MSQWCGFWGVELSLEWHDLEDLEAVTVSWDSKSSDAQIASILPLILLGGKDFCWLLREGDFCS